MGVSTDGIVAFGFDLGEDFPEGCDPTEDEQDFDNYVIAKLGLQKPDHSNYDNDDWKEFFRESREAVKAFPITIKLHCSYDYPMYFLAVRRTLCDASRGYPKSFEPIQPTQEEIAAMRSFCDEFCIEWKEPSWHVFSLWG